METINGDDGGSVAGIRRRIMEPLPDNAFTLLQARSCGIFRTFTG